MSTKLSDLRLAITQDRPDQLKELLSNSNDFNINDVSTGPSLLQSALELREELKDEECFCLLLEHGASLDTLKFEELRGPSVFTHELLFQFLLTLSSSSFISSLPQIILSQPLMYAIQNGDTNLMELILNKNSRISNYTNYMGLSPLHLLAVTPNFDESLLGAQILISHGAKIDKISHSDLATPLHYACRHGKIEIVDLLLKESHDPSSLLLIQDSLGRTPVHVTIYERQWELLNALIQSYYDLLKSVNDIVDYEGYTIAGLLFHIRQRCMPLDYQLCIPCLSVNEANWCLHEGAHNNDLNGVNFALSEGANVDVFDFSFQNPLILVAKLGHTSICTRLLEGGADVTLADWSGLTPLHHAANNGHETIVNELLNHSQNSLSIIEAKSRNGSTPLQLALIKGHFEITGLLLSANNQKRERVDWMSLLSAAAPLNDVFIIKKIIELYCPLRWTQELVDCGWNYPPSSYDENNEINQKRSYLQILVPLQGSPRLFLKDILTPKLAKKKFEKHREMLSGSNCQQFIDDPHLMKKKIRGKSKPCPYQLSLIKHNSPSVISDMISAKNWTCLSFLIKEMRRGNNFFHFLKTKDSSGMSGAVLLSKVISFVNDNSLEREVIQTLKEEFPLPENVSLVYALIHLLTVKLSSTVAFNETPLKRWPELLVSHYFTQFTSIVKYTEHLSINDAIKLTSAILKSEDIHVFKPLTSTLPSLVFMTVTNRINISFLRLLLEQGVTTFPDLSSLQKMMLRWADTRRRVYPQVRTAFVEALVYKLYEHADLIIDKIGLKVMLPAPVESEEEKKERGEEREKEEREEREERGLAHQYSSGSSTTSMSSFESSDATTQSLIFSLFHGLRCLSSDCFFDFVLKILLQLPQPHFDTFLLSETSVVVFSASLSSQNGNSLAEFLYNKFIEFIASLIRKNELTLFKLIDGIINQGHYHSQFKLGFELCVFLNTYDSSPCHFPFLLHLCGCGYTKLVKLVLSGHEKEVVYTKSHKGYTPLYLAASGGHYDIVEYLIKEGGATMDPHHYGLYHPLLGVLMYFNYVLKTSNGYRSCIRCEFSEDIYICPFLNCSDVYKDATLAKKLVNLVLPENNVELVAPVEYLRAMTNLHQHDLSPFVRLIEIFPAIVFSQLSIDDTEICTKNEIKMFISDYALYTARHFSSHPSPKLCEKFLSNLFSFISPSNPLMAAKLCYWNIIKVCLPTREPRVISNEVQKCKWGDVVRRAVNNSQRKVVKYLMNCLKDKREEIDESISSIIIMSFCHGGEEWCDFLSDFLSFCRPSDDVILKGLKSAANKGNLPALKCLHNYRKGVLGDNLTSVLVTGASRGHKKIVTFLNNHHEHIEHQFNDSNCSFWLVVLIAATKHNRKDMCLFAIESLSYYDMHEICRFWDLFPEIVNSCCWWGLSDVLQSLSIQDPSVYLISDQNGCTPFESACSNGHYSYLTDLDSFPQFESVENMTTMSQNLFESFLQSEECLPALLQALNTGWWQETMKLSQYLQQEEETRYIDSNAKISDGFVGALTNNVQVIIEAHLNIWGNKNASIIMQAIGEDVVILKKAILSGNSYLVETIVRTLFDTNFTLFVARKFITPVCIAKVIYCDDVSMLKCLSECMDLSEIRAPHSYYNILHYLALYGRSGEMYDCIVSLVDDVSLLTAKDCTNLSPCENALANGNYRIGAKLYALMKKRDLTFTFNLEDISCHARGWFDGLMQYNQNTKLKGYNDILPVKGSSLREAKSLRNYCHTIKRINERVSDTLLEASLGVFAE